MKTLFRESVFLLCGKSFGGTIEKPITALLLMLGFMLFSFVLITIVPTMARKKERELEVIEDENFY